jgi:hypothetical protein
MCKDGVLLPDLEVSHQYKLTCLFENTGSHPMAEGNETLSVIITVWLLFNIGNLSV